MNRPTLGIPESLHVRPLVYGLGAPGSPWRIEKDIPAKLSVNLSQRIPPLEAGCAFLSPIDYARYGGDYRIVPGISASSRRATRTIQLLVRDKVRTIGRVAVDLRVTTEIALLKIILLEKYPGLSDEDKAPEFLAVGGSIQEQLQNADALLLVNLGTAVPSEPETFALDLVEEWVDLTELPYPHGFWVGHEDTVDGSLISLLAGACRGGSSNLPAVADELARSSGTPSADVQTYLSHFSYELDEEVEEAISEFFRYAYYHGMLKDIPDLKFAGSDQG